MPAGKRRFLITIQQAVMSDDASGQPLHSWSLYCTRYADVEQTSGTERFRGRQIDASMTHVAVIVSDSVTRAITPGMRFLWRGRVVNLIVVKPLDGKIREIQLMGQEYIQA